MSQHTPQPRHDREAQRDLTENERAEQRSRRQGEAGRQAPFDHDTGAPYPGQRTE
ncbi:hypothetical protein N8I74_08520 [Chitiniphilus purpureus]|uniref:Uncharacterized protein n=1 Tax=Chitiniphilus purpureus TaxID=2981137 RepID=A0ABY6DYV5_9NEIS|nr:hypothetical protein [Chitiniphilus sp. CD1]UXY17038.1 hypothetical protein N8I74_08520 [Chitiniphilus sp. CD1]